MKARWAGLLLLALAACGDDTLAGGDAERVRVRGTVMRADTGEPVEGARVVGPGGVSARSGPGGTFVLKAIPRGAQGEVRATLEDDWSAAVTLRPIETPEIEIVLHLTQD